MINLTIARFFLGVNSLHPIPALENDMGWESATERQRLQTLLYFRKIMIMDPNRICYKVLREMESDFDSRSWLGKIRPLLVELNLESDILVNCSHEEAKSIIRYRLSDLKQRRWNDEVLRRLKLDFYNKIFGFRSIPLADFVLHREGRRFLCRLVGGTLPIRVNQVDILVSPERRDGVDYVVILIK